MPELPDIVVYCEALSARVVGHVLREIRLASPFLLRSVDPPLAALAGRRALAVERLGKRIVFHFEGDLYAVLHLMIAGRLKPAPLGAKIPARIGAAAFDFEANEGGPGASFLLTEAAKKKRASLVVTTRAALPEIDPGGLEIASADRAAFAERLTAENHTLKRTLTDPHLFSGIGNAYSDEILFRARLSPLALTQKLSPDAVTALFEATRSVLEEWTERLRLEAGGEFPLKVTAFRPEMAVHGRFGAPCPTCGAAVQRIVHGEHESNYCATCQTGGKLLADRALSRLLKKDWPRTLEELETRKSTLRR